MSEDKDLERLQAKRLEEMRKNLSSQQEKEKIAASQKEQKDKKSSPREIISQAVRLQGPRSFAKCRVSVSKRNGDHSTETI